ncbi:MAG: hypothetical protein C4524_11430 [Candidatus Zixiibacteriota bacterium]|nr:MAG: hypothetical protein C4524_11430 [candidate division Zixibacteria bacterium]
MITTQTHQGLCTTCVASATCTFPRPAGKPVIFCEEFDGYLRNGHVENPDVNAILAHVNVKPAPQATLKGLCANCELRDTCTFPKAEGGIWHCEEYR